MPQHTSTRQTPNTAGAADGEVLPPDTNDEPTPTPGGAIPTPETAPEASDIAADTGPKSEADAGSSEAAEGEAGVSEGAETEADRSANAGNEAEAGTSPAAETGQAETPAPELTVEAPPEATAEAAPGTVSAVKSLATEDADATASEAADTEAPGSGAAVKATATASDTEPEAEPDASATITDADAGADTSATDTDSHADTDVDADTSTDSVTAPSTAPEAAADTDLDSPDAPETPDQAATPDPAEATTPRPKRPGPRTWSSRLGLRRRMQAWREKHPVAALTLSWVVTFLAAVLVYICLEMPNTLGQLRLMEFARVPAEAIMAAVILLSLPRRPRIILAAGFGALVGAIAVLNMFDMGFNEYLGRHFNIILDWSLFGDARGYLKDTFGGTATQVITVGVIALIVALIVLVALAMIRLSNVLVTYKAIATKGTLIAGTVWITLTAFALEFHGIPLAADHTAGVIKYQVRAVQETLRDEAEFKKVAKVDAFGNTPGSQLVPDLRGKDMIFTFIESYGRSAIEDPIMAPGVDATLSADTKALSKAGFAAKSGWLTSATYGGSSWLGHSTTMSGLWVNNQQRYRTVMASDHLSLTDAFKKTGDFDTVGVMPGVQKGWPEQSFYGLDKVYNAFQLGYKGPKFSWSTMPDQYALEQFQKQVHSKPRTDGKSLMSMIILTSSHQPWAPIPKLVPWDQLGNGSIFDAIEKAGNKASDVIADTTKSRQEYGKSIQYSVNSLTQWLERYGNDNTVLVFLGDHQPIARVSGNHASRDVPISIVAKDPKVLAKIDSWNWTDGLRPAHDAPVWKMSAFRDKFLTAYGSTPHPKTN